MSSVTVRYQLVLAFALLPCAADAQQIASSCETCHQDSDLFEPELTAIVSDFRGGVHAEVGLLCHDCHGGDPDPELAEDFDGAKPEDGERAFIGSPARIEVPGLCGLCHSDPTYMKRFKPDTRVDQEAEYWTSGHGKALAAGDSAVATCTDCHGAHDVQRPSSPSSRVYPTRVAETCHECHGDAGTMGAYALADGRPFPTDQYARWRHSVHAAAMFELEDLTAPTCNDCHGNHGAAPPGLDSIDYVCGQCHGREAEIFRASAKHDGFQEHNEWLADAGEEGCAMCHDAGPQGIGATLSFTQCSSCHRNHAVIRPTIALFNELPATPCAFCHEEEDALAGPTPEPERSRRSYDETLAALLSGARAAGLSGTGLFDHLVDVAQGLPVHTIARDGDDEQQAVLKPEFAELFSKFRIGKTSYTFPGSTNEEAVTVEVIRCSACHEFGVEDDQLEVGAATGIQMVQRMHQLTARTARAERTLLAARRGGVETRDALIEIDQAVDAQIGLEVLVHTFSTAEDGPFEQLYGEGLEHAEGALTSGHEALDELRFRRRGLAAAVVVILVVLVALGLKIRELSRRESLSADSSGS